MFGLHVSNLCEMTPMKEVVRTSCRWLVEESGISGRAALRWSSLSLRQSAQA